VRSARLGLIGRFAVFFVFFPRRAVHDERVNDRFCMRVIVSSCDLACRRLTQFSIEVLPPAAVTLRQPVALMLDVELRSAPCEQIEEGCQL